MIRRLGLTLLLAHAGGEARAASPTLVESGFAPVNGLKVYYEAHGRREGLPLVLLPGGGSTIEATFGRILPFLARHRRVIAVEEQGHGRTSDRDRPVRFETSADDVAALLDHLKLEEADLFGFSNGASVALQVALRQPRRVRKLVFASSMTRKEGAYPQFWEFMKQADFSDMPQPLKDAFLKVNPDPAELRVMHDKDLDRMLNFNDVGDEDLRSIRAPTLILIGDQDIVKPEHAAELARLIPRSRLAVLPGRHGEYMGELVMTTGETGYPELTAGLIEEFLSGGRRMNDVQHISVSIDRRPADVYQFASDPGNLPRWAAGLARSEVRKAGDEWVADSPMGKVRVRFAGKNPYGVLDHDVILSSGVAAHNPMRVVPNGDGSEFIFTLIRRPGMSDEDLAGDRAAVEKDLRALKELLERR